MTGRTGRVLVTGAGGMIGSEVVRTLVQARVAVSAHLGLPGDAFVTPPPGVGAVFGSITDLSVVRRAAAGADVVVHLAGPPSVAASFDDPRGFVEAHVLGAATVLQVCRELGISRLVQISSAEVYGRHEQGPVPETAAALPLSPYGAAKLGAEALVRAEAVHDGLGAVVLRPFSVYGPRSPARSLLGTLVRQARSAEAVEPLSLAPVRDYVHVHDLARAVVAALAVRAEDLPEGGLVANVGSGVGTSVAELAALVVRLSGRRVPVRQAPGGDRPAGARGVSLVADITVARARLGWVPLVSLPDGVHEVLRAVADDRG